MMELGRTATLSAGIARIPHLATLIGADEVDYPPRPWRRYDTVVGWGRKPNTRAARRYAEVIGAGFVALEDGFLRSVGLGVDGDAPLSAVLDRAGIFYDATRPSDLERIIGEHEWDADVDADRARRCIASIREHGLSKYNDAPAVDLGPSTQKRILVVDQSAGDLSIRLGRCVSGGFQEMLQAARSEHPDAEILVKTHPDVLSGKRESALGDAEGVRVLSENANPPRLLDQVDHVYVMTSLLGFEALMAGKRVTCFGVPWYAGWGLTDDRQTVGSRRGRGRTVEELFAAAYLRYSRYIDPETGLACEIERVVEHLALQRHTGERTPSRITCVGFSRWKRSFIPRFLRGPGTRVEFASEKDARVDGGTVVVWGTRPRPELERRLQGAPLWRMEDGFLRSVGLGSDLFAPASLVLDSRGIYYDPRTPSDLEAMLQNARFDDEVLVRARRLRESIVETGVSKYNQSKATAALGAPDGGRTVLVVGQVEDDASIQLGCLDVRTNERLLREARDARPEAHLIYKPHPDVVSGNRRDSLPLDMARDLCDDVVLDASLASCLAIADEVHTMTSLVGFEALLRELSVHVYGHPFYAGWGLTHDRHPHERRQRRLSLDELVAGALILYPRYVHPRSKQYSTPEAIIASLLSTPPPAPWETRPWGRQVRKVVNLAQEVFGAS